MCRNGGKQKREKKEEGRKTIGDRERVENKWIHGKKGQGKKKGEMKKRPKELAIKYKLMGQEKSGI